MRIGFMINSLRLIDNAKALIESSDNDYFVIATSDVYKAVKDLFSNVYEVEVPRHKTFPFVDKVCAAAEAEKLGIDVWMDVDSLFLKDVSFNDEFQVAPVDIKNIGSKTIDEFWGELYSIFDIHPTSYITTRVSSERILPYYNFGFVVNFKHYQYLKTKVLELLDGDTFNNYFADYKYKIFFHQAIFTCIVLKYYNIRELDFRINYPLNENSCLDDIKSIRYDTCFNDGFTLEPYTDKYDLTIDWIYS